VHNRKSFAERQNSESGSKWVNKKPVREGKSKYKSFLTSPRLWWWWWGWCQAEHSLQLSQAKKQAVIHSFKNVLLK
jgi:hypothetical protein